MPIHHTEDMKKRASERMKLITMRLRCYLWLGNSADPIEGFTFLSDFSEKGAGLYMGKKIDPGREVRIAFESKENPPIVTEVIWCNRYSLEQHFLGHQALNFRLGLKYIFATEAERQRYIEFMEGLKRKCKSIGTGMIF